MIERVQRKFLYHAIFKFNVPCPPHDYKPIQRLFPRKSR
ncbi:Reverse transcriptase domain-containing protein [Aphis craccivora]|uniref:Reverse transcriptase domain-containing protein n=1 Tax=Aphis craccivora TaxID=307492 RepID=A0A6G0Z954_APHCR|nr:Reverse transcriptase domain-containing protein [Aphis craccivora]